MSKSDNQRDNSLDFARGLAILLVLIHHQPFNDDPSDLWHRVTGPIVRIGWIGVDLFFVLSGFLIGGLLMREVQETGRLNAKRFLTRRAYKLWPSYFVFLLLAGFLFRPQRIPEIVPNLVHLQNYLGTPIAHTWSLAVEEHFYLAIVIAIALFTRARHIDFKHVAWLCGATFLLCPLARLIGVLVGESPTLMDRATHNRIDTLALGILLAALYRFRPEAFGRIASQRFALATVAVFGIAFLFLVDDQSTFSRVMRYDMVALAAAATILLLFAAKPGVGWWGKARTTIPYAAVAAVGYYSYGIYLWHLSGVSVYRALASRAHVPHPLDSSFGNLMFILLAVGIGCVSTKLIEEPMLRLRERKAPNRDRALAYGPSEVSSPLQP